MGHNIHLGFWKKVGIFKNSVYHYSYSIKVTIHRCSLNLLAYTSNVPQMYEESSSISEEGTFAIIFRPTGTLFVYLLAVGSWANLWYLCSLSWSHWPLYCLSPSYSWNPYCDPMLSDSSVVSVDRLLPYIITILMTLNFLTLCCACLSHYVSQKLFSISICSFKKQLFSFKINCVLEYYQRKMLNQS